MVELLIAGAVLVIVLALTTSFFAQQSNLSRRTQAISDMQDRLRLTMHLLTTDLVLSGASAYVGDGHSGVANGQTAQLAEAPGVPGIPFNMCEDVSGTPVKCFALDSSTPTEFRLSSTYVNSLRPLMDSCREVTYLLVDASDVLRRGDLYCSDVPTVADPASIALTDVWDAVRGIVAVDVRLHCVDNTVITSAYPHATCVPRSADVAIVARTQDPIGSDSESFTLPSGTTVACPSDYRCSLLRQEVVLPNLREGI